MYCASKAYLSWVKCLRGALCEGDRLLYLNKERKLRGEWNKVGGVSTQDINALGVQPLWMDFFSAEVFLNVISYQGYVCSYFY